METIGAISEGQWSSFNGLCPEEAHFVARLLGNCLLPSEMPSSFVLPDLESNDKIVEADESTMFSSHKIAIARSFSLGNTDCSEDDAFFFPSSSHGNYYNSASQQSFVPNNSLTDMDYSMMGNKNNDSRVCFITDNVMETNDFFDADVSNDSLKSNESAPDDVLEGNSLQPAMVHETPVAEPFREAKFSITSEISKKRSRLPGEIQRNGSMKLKKCLNLDNDDNDDYESNYIDTDDNSNIPFLKKRTNSWCSDDESIASLEQTHGTTSISAPNSKGGRVLNSNGKIRASRGSATDPQSLYARKRRDRINERLRILQGLVPNGTKVDISTMLEEAVQYVKFLQLQIKLLSSDDLWMYAPIAYNGMDIGLHIKITSPKEIAILNTTITTTAATI